MSDAVPASPQAPKPLWRNLNFTLMWTSVAASGFGDRLIMMIALALLLIGRDTGDAKSSYQASIQFFFFAPYLLLSPPAGWLADTFPRKWIMVICDLVRAGILGLMFFTIMPSLSAQSDASANGQVSEGVVWLVIASVGCMAAIFSPTRNATVPMIVPETQLQAGNAILVALATISSLIGQVVGGEMLGDNAPPQTLRNTLLISVAIYLAGAACLSSMRVPARVVTVKANEDVGLARLFRASHYILRHRRIAALILVNLLVWTAAFIVYTALIAVCARVYGVPGKDLITWYARLSGMLGAGMLVGAVVIAAMNTLRESAIVGLVGLLLAGAATVLLAVIPSLAIGMVMCFAVGFFGNFAIICFVTLAQGISPDYTRGRVMGVYMFATTIASVLVNLVIWRMGDAADQVIIVALYVTGPVMMAVAAWQLFGHVTRGPMPRGIQNVFWRLDRLFMLVWHRVEWVGKDRVPSGGPVILASNHTAGIDPFLIQAGVRRPIRWVMVRKNFYRALNPLWRAIAPIVLDPGKQPIKQLKTVLEALTASQIVGIFPEGGLQRDHRMLQPMQSGVGMMAVRSGARIVPVWVTGTPMHKRMWAHFLKPSRSRVYFGQAYTPDSNRSYEEIVEDLRQRMVALAIEAEGKAPQETDVPHGQRQV